MTDSSRGDNTAAAWVSFVCDLSGGDDSTCLYVIAVVDVVGFSFRSVSRSDTLDVFSLCISREFSSKFSVCNLFLLSMVINSCLLCSSEEAH